MAYFRFAPELRLHDSTYDLLGIPLESSVLNPKGEESFAFGHGVRANEISKAIVRGDVAGFGVETTDKLRTEGSALELDKASQYMREFFGHIDIDAVLRRLDPGVVD